MNVYKKLQTARIKLQQTELKKSGKNKFAGYEYFELGDFLPAIQRICDEVGLCGVVSYDEANAHLTIYDTDGDGTVVFSSPMSSAELKGCHAVQNLGAVQTYLRRYLWTNAFEIVEHDALDAVTGSAPVKPMVVPKVEPKVEAKPIVGAEGEWQIKAPPKPDGDKIDEWLLVVEKTTEIALGMAGKEEDVMQIFKKNKTLFDTVKEIDAVCFKDLMAKFTEAKNKFKEAA
jgi:hypothetical protein